MYTAVVLNPLSAACLRWAARATFPFEENDFSFATNDYALPHHMTLNMGDYDTGLNEKVSSNDPVDIVVVQLAYDLEMGVCAAIVQSSICRKDCMNQDIRRDIRLKTKNTCPHITVALKPGVKPFKSNAMLEGTQETTKIVTLPEPMTLQGHIRECD